MISSVMLAATASSAASAPRFSNGTTTMRGHSVRSGSPRASSARSASRNAACCQVMTPIAPRSTRDQRQRDAPPRRSAGAALGHGLGRGRRHARRLRARIHEVVLDGVAAARQLDPDGIAFAFARVVLDQSPAQATRLDAHQRVGLRVEVGGPAEHLDADRVTLQPLPAAGQRLFGDEAQEMRRAVRLLKVATRENPLELAREPRSHSASQNRRREELRSRRAFDCRTFAPQAPSRSQHRAGAARWQSRRCAIRLGHRGVDSSVRAGPDLTQSTA